MPTTEDIKAQLTECYKIRKPVLLCGDTSIDYVDLVVKIHTVNGGIEDSWEYSGSDETIKTVDSMVEGVRKAIEERNYVKMDEILRNSKSTPATMVFFDWSAYDCNSLYKQLVIKEGYSDLNHMLSHLSIEYVGTRGNMFLDFEPRDDGTYWPLSLIERKGLLFIINLLCQTDEDKRIYERLASYIKARKDNDHKSGDWLVMHTYDPSGFPDYFRNQLVEIPLDGKKTVAKPSGTTIESEERQEGKVKKSVPSKYNWSEVEIIFIDNENVKIKIGCGKDKRNYSEMGFKDGRTGKSDRAWKRLMLFALQDGRITCEFNENVLKKNNNYYVKPKDIESINEKLRAYFKVIHENPIPPYNKKEKCYKIGLKHIGITDNHRKHLKSILANKPREDEDMSDGEYFNQARNNNYSSSSYSDKLEDDPLYKDDDQNHTPH